MIQYPLVGTWGPENVTNDFSPTNSKALPSEPQRELIEDRLLSRHNRPFGEEEEQKLATTPTPLAWE